MCTVSILCVTILRNLFSVCADTSIIRTATREELLYPRSKLALAAKAFGLQAIDMVGVNPDELQYLHSFAFKVCVNYKDKDILREECTEGRRLGYSGKASSM